MTIRELISKGSSKLNACNIENAKGDARSIFCHIYDINLSELFLSMDKDVDERIGKMYLSLIEKRCQGIPLQHIIGKQEFMGFTFLVNEDVLIPRRETEELVEEVVSIIGDKKVKLLDLCCGSGAIGISLAKLTGASVLCADISDKALQMTKKNIELNKVNDVKVIKSDMFEKIEGTFDLIVSNPPYIKRDVIYTLAKEVRDYEPLLALDGGNDGLDFYRTLVKEAVKHLKPNGVLAMEIGYDQGEELKELIGYSGNYKNIKVLKDLSKKDRMVIAYKREA